MQHIAAELSTGKVYSAQHPDKHGRLVFVIRTHKHLQGKAIMFVKIDRFKSTALAGPGYPMQYGNSSSNT